MLSNELLLEPMESVCMNCLTELWIWVDSEGKGRCICPHCYAKSEIELLSRRKFRVEMTAPQGQVLRYKLKRNNTI